MKIILIIFSFLLFIRSQAQISSGTWRFHSSTKKAIDIAVSEATVFTAFENGLFEYNIASSEKKLWTSMNGLSDIEISCIYFCDETNQLYIGYKNGNIDILRDGEIINIPAVKLAAVANSKKINKFRRFGDFMLASTDFSIVKIDDLKKEIKDTYYPTDGLEKIVDVALIADTLFALTPSKLIYANYLNPILSDPSAWSLDSRLPQISTNFYGGIEYFNNCLFVLFKSQEYGSDTLYRLTNNGTIVFASVPFSQEINSISASESYLLINSDGGISLFNANLLQTAGYSASNFNQSLFSVANSELNSTGLWSADKNVGLMYFSDEVTVQSIPINGTKNQAFYSMDSEGGKVAIATGGLSGNVPLFSHNGIHFFQEEEWSNINGEQVSSWQNQNIWDFLDVSINPKNSEQSAVCTYSEFPLSIIENGNVQNFNASNSTLEVTALGNNWSLVSDVCYDARGNLWALNGFTLKPLNVMDNNGVWYNYDVGAAARNKFTKKMIVDFDGNIWFATSSDGMFGYSTNNSLANPSDDEYINLKTGVFSGDLPSQNVTALAADFDGEIWIGTDAGFAILYNANSAFTAAAGEYDAQRIKVEFEGNVEYLLGNTHITDIEVDGGNRKWMATASAGILLLSQDGSEIIEQHTTQNSPLISDNILDLKLDQTTGELFIITDKGLVSYRTNATYEDPEYSTTKVFPNPVRPTFSGLVTIEGIRYDSDVKITDIAGNLVYKTTSNGGTATWDVKTLDGQAVASGVYIIWTATNEAKDGQDKIVGKVLVIR
jgi:hypothetical protein